jgi:hypothetical protein
MRWNRRKDLRAGGYWRCAIVDREGQRRYRQANPDLVKARLRAWQSANVAHRRAYQRQWRYGIEPAEYDRINDEQRGLCALCDLPATEAPKGSLHIDHDHATGRIRGLICLRCNSALERVERPDWLERVARYLK